MCKWREEIHGTGMENRGGRVTEWSARRTRHPAAPGFDSRSGHLLDLFSVVPSSNPRQLVQPSARWGFLILLCSICIIFFSSELFDWSACKLAGQWEVKCTFHYNKPYSSGNLWEIPSMELKIGVYVQFAWNPWKWQKTFQCNSDKKLRELCQCKWRYLAMLGS